MRKTSVLAAFMLIQSAVPGGAEPSLAEQLLRRTGAPAGAAAFWSGRGDSVSVAGLRRAGGDPAQVGDLWHIGSNTKAMTAAVAARLVEAGHIRWDSRLGDVLGDAVPMRDIYRDITLHELLLHRAGLPANESPLRTIVQMAHSPAPRTITRQRLNYARAILAGPAGGERGDFLYSNASYTIAGAMLEQTMGQPWETLAYDWLFAPLGIDSAGFGPPQGAQPEGHSHAAGDCLARGQGPASDNPAYIGPAGTVHMALPDMMIWLRANARHDPILSAESWARLHQPVGEYALGWGVSEPGELFHNGSNTMWFASFAFQTDPPAAVALVVNCGAGDGVQDMARMVMRQIR